MTTTYSLADAIGFLASFVLPLAVAAATKMTTHPRVQALVLLGLTVLTTSLTDLTKAVANQAQGFSYVHWLVALIMSFAFAVVGHFGLWKPIGASAALLRAFTSDDGKAQVVTALKAGPRHAVVLPGDTVHEPDPVATSPQQPLENFAPGSSEDQYTG